MLSLIGEDSNPKICHWYVGYLARFSSDYSANFDQLYLLTETTKNTRDDHSHIGSNVFWKCVKILSFWSAEISLGSNYGASSTKWACWQGSSYSILELLELESQTVAKWAWACAGRPLPCNPASRLASSLNIMWCMNIDTGLMYSSLWLICANPYSTCMRQAARKVQQCVQDSCVSKGFVNWMCRRKPDQQTVYSFRLACW